MTNGKFEPKQFGRYVLLDRLAMGGMAEIYKAKTYGAEGFEKLLAIKRILPHAAADKEFIHMLIDEAKLSVVLSHANIVQVYDLGKVGEDYFISMEYINGINLRDLIYRLREHGKRILPELSVFMISEVCKGLDYAHRKTDANGHPLGIVHRDISPQNILISFEGEVKIVDFGIAKAAMNISHTMAGILKGKIAYMSPEQALGKTVDYRTDIFSAGIMLYEALTGQKLFNGESQFEVLKKIRTTKVDLKKLPESIPIALREILAKALAYNPADRYQSAGDMQLDLTKYLYSTYIEFSPQKLAAFLRESFSDEIKQLERKRKTDAQTTSVKLDEKLAQQDIVHRDNTATDLDEDVEPEEEVGEETKATPISKSRRMLREAAPKKRSSLPIIILSVLLLSAGIGFALYRFFPKGKAPVAPQEPVIAKPVLPPPPPPTPVEVPVPTGIINIISDPSGAAVLLNNKTTGLITPATLEKLPLQKELKITLSKPEYNDYEQDLTLLSESPQKISALLRPVAKPKVEEPTPPPKPEPKPVAKKEPVKTPPKEKQKPSPPPVKKESPREEETATVETTGAPATLKVASNPGGAEIFVNAEYKGTTPATLEIPPGRVNLLVNKEGKIRYSKVLTVRPGEKIDLTNIRLGDLYGQISINSTPPRAEVILDGQRLGAKTPVTIRNVRRDKNHTLRLEMGGHKPWERDFSMEDTEDKKFNILFEKD